LASTRRYIILLTLSLGFLHLVAQQPANALSGIVTDSATGKRLAGISVFLNNTSRGTVTGDNGTFQLTDMPKGAYQLVFSSVGYKTFVIEVNSGRLPPPLDIRLTNRVTELTSVTVAPYDKHGWAKYGKFFVDNYIGISENAGSCSLKNRAALRFYFSKRSNRLIVTSTEPLRIENNALGYILLYQLETFTADFTNKIVSYYGYPLFRQMVPKNENRRKKWEFKRKESYTGSIMHFMRSLYAGRAVTAGFLMQKEVMAPNEEKERIKQVYRPDFQKPGLFPMDTLHYFWEVLRQPDPIKKTITISPDSILTVYADGTRGLYFNGALIILFGVNARTAEDYKTSGLVLTKPQIITVQENGSYSSPRDLMAQGAWALSEKICNLLPLDFPAGP
jgi:CarboxypepD_reg-like domain